MTDKPGVLSYFANAVNSYITDIKGTIKPFLGIMAAGAIAYYLDFLNGIFTGISGLTAGALLIISVLLLVLKTVINYIGSVSLYSMYPYIYDRLTGNKNGSKLKFTEWKKTFVITIVFFILRIPALLGIAVPLFMVIGNLAMDILFYRDIGQIGTETLSVIAVPSVLIGITGAIIYLFLVSLFTIFVPYEYFLEKQSIISSFKKSINLVKNNLGSSTGMLILVTIADCIFSVVVFLPALCCFIFPIGVVARTLVLSPITILSKMKLWHGIREKPPKSL